MSRISVHPAAVSSGPGVAKVVPVATASGRALTSSRTEGRAKASEIVAVAAGSVTLSAVAKSLGVSSKQAWKWAQVDQPDAITFGDIIAADPDFAESALLQALAIVRARRNERSLAAPIGIERRVRRVTVAHGRVVECVEDALANDGVIDEDEASSILRASREERTRLEVLEREVIAVAVGARR